MRNTILVVLGTRPEAIKLAPVIFKLRGSKTLKPFVCSTGQHDELLRQVLEDFFLEPDMDLKLMYPGQCLAKLSSRLIQRLDEVVARIDPACLLVQGDTTTAMAGALSAFYRHVPVAHVEAGLRTGDMEHPFPEELNRRIISLVADLHFAPTYIAAENLRREGIAAEKIYITGNTIVDSVKYMLEEMNRDVWQISARLKKYVECKKRLVVVTLHRRENIDHINSICEAIKRISDLYNDILLVFPVHKNPSVSTQIYALLREAENVDLIPSLSYKDMLWLLQKSFLILSDSGGIQEEATALGKRLLILRTNTERPECITSGCCSLVGVGQDDIVNEFKKYEKSGGTAFHGTDILGDGTAASCIVEHLENFLQHQDRYI